MKIIRFGALVLIAGLYACSAGAVNGSTNITSAGGGTVAELKNLLGDDVEFVVGDGGQAINYCPDNTCYSIRARDGKTEELAEFSLLYFYYASTYYTVLDGFRREAKNEVEHVLSENAGGCTGSGKDRVSCVLRKMATGNSIEIVFVRYDENRKNEEVLNLDAELEKIRVE